jgi:hypothetical protein
MLSSGRGSVCCQEGANREGAEGGRNGGGRERCRKDREREGGTKKKKLKENATIISRKKVQLSWPTKSPLSLEEEGKRYNYL